MATFVPVHGGWHGSLLLEVRPQGDVSAEARRVHAHPDRRWSESQNI